MIADFLRHRMQALDMSQADLARQLTLRGKSYTRAAVQQWLNGKNSPPLKDREFRYALAASLEMDVNQLLKEIGFAIDDSLRSHEALRGADIIDRLPAEGKELALKYLEVLDEHYVKSG